MDRPLFTRMRNLATDVALGIRTRRIVETGIPDGKHCSTVDYALVENVLDAMHLVDSDVFVDIGCGLGRALCSAARHPVREAIGIEGDPTIARECECNARRMSSRGLSRAGKVTVIASLADDESLDAVWRIGTAYYLFCPFGEETLRRVATRILQSLDHPVRIAYVNPAYESALAAAGFHRTEFWPRTPSRNPNLEVAFWTAGDEPSRST
jgi:hypothetical protein